MLHHFLSVPGPPACERAAPPAAGWWWRPAPSGCGSVSPRCPAAAAGRSSRRRTPAPAPEPSHAPAPPDSDTHTDTAMRRQRDSEGGRERRRVIWCVLTVMVSSLLARTQRCLSRSLSFSLSSSWRRRVSSSFSSTQRNFSSTARCRSDRKVSVMTFIKPLRTWFRVRRWIPKILYCNV